MIDELKKIENAIFEINKLQITNISNEDECEEYFGTNFILNNANIKFRKAKITPKKAGQFVTLWKRNSHNQTEPYSVNDNFDFYIIAVKENEQFGFFIFPRNILSKNQILSNSEKTGKRGFRVYPDWTKTESKQAQKTQAWQVAYFINLNNKFDCIKKFNQIFFSN